MPTATPNFSNSCPGFKALLLRKMLLWRQLPSVLACWKSVWLRLPLTLHKPLWLPRRLSLTLWMTVFTGNVILASWSLAVQIWWHSSRSRVLVLCWMC